jgi:hypothetical protein
MLARCCCPRGWRWPGRFLDAGQALSLPQIGYHFLDNLGDAPLVE